jgi:predicted ester cyclase
LKKGTHFVSKGDNNKAIVDRSFAGFWGKDVNLAIVDEIAAPDMLLQYTLHGPRRGREDIKAFITGFRAAFSDLNFRSTADLIAEGDYVVSQWEGGGTHTGPAFNDFLKGSLPAATGRKMQFTGTTVLKVIDGMIVEEIGLDDGLTAMTQLGVVAAVARTRVEMRVEFDRALEALKGRVDDAFARTPAIDQGPLLSLPYVTLGL